MMEVKNKTQRVYKVYKSKNQASFLSSSLPNKARNVPDTYDYRIIEIFPQERQKARV